MPSSPRKYRRGGVNRIALAGDRVAKVVRSPDGFAVEHDAASGDLYLRPATPAAPEDPPPAAARETVTLFIGTEKGFTYRLTLTPADRGSAQILIRNADVMAVASVAAKAPAASDPQVAALVRLVRAVARREPLPGYAIEAGGPPLAGFTLLETWRGPRFAAHVLEADRSPLAGTSDVAGLAGTIADALDTGRVAALWLAAPGTGPTGGQLAVAVVDAPAGEPR